MPTERNGFTLVEVLVALIASGLLIGIVMNGAVLARDRAVKAAEQREAVLLARHLLASAAVRPFSNEATEGREEGLAWRIRETALAADPRGGSVLAAVALTVTNADGANLLSAEARMLKRVDTR